MGSTNGGIALNVKDIFAIIVMKPSERILQLVRKDAEEMASKTGAIDGTGTIASVIIQERFAELAVGAIIKYLDELESDSGGSK